MAGVDEKNVEEFLIAFRRTKAALTLEEMHLASIKASTSKMTLQEIDSEIKAIRKERKHL